MKKIDAERIIDIAVIGAGPAGLAAALYAARGGAYCVVFEELSPGGAAALTDKIDNYPGFPDGIEGYMLGLNLEKQALRFGAVVVNCSIAELQLEGEYKTIVTDKERYIAKTIIIATGSKPKKLGLPNESELIGKGVSYCATCDGAFFKGMDVAVIGGGDTALADALYLSGFAAKVYIVHRRDEFRAAKTLVDNAKNIGNIEFILDSVCEEIHAEATVNALTLLNKKTNTKSKINVNGIFIAVGIIPSSQLAAGKLSLDAGSCIIADEHMRTSQEGVYAAGDVRNTVLRQVVTAVSDGAIAATDAIEYISNKRWG